MVGMMILSIIILASCANHQKKLHIQKVGMLVDGMVSDNPWNEQGFQGLLAIGEEFDVGVYYRENIQTKEDTVEAVSRFAKDGVNLIFGHSNIYGKFFSEIAKDYPHVHFVYFNGGYFDENLSSLNLNSQAMGFFTGMVAGEMTQTKQVGIIAAYEWQPEIEGFFEGVRYQTDDTKVQIDFLNEWNDEKNIAQIYEKMREKNVDIFYPAGESFSADLVEIIENEQDDHMHIVGYLTDHFDEDSSILMTMIQHIDKLYMYAAEQFNTESLEGGITSFGFQDGIVTLGEFSSEVPKMLQMKIGRQAEKFIETNLLPHQQ